MIAIKQKRWWNGNRLAGLSLWLTLALAIATATNLVKAPPLAGTSWEPVSMGTPGEMVQLGVKSLTFKADGKVNGGLGFTECAKNYVGPYTADDRSIQFGPLLVNLLYCPHTTMESEGGKYLTALHEAHSYERTRESLILNYRG